MIFSIERNKSQVGKTAYPYREEYIRINGISEYLLHCPSAPENPVVLHIHGGPGAPASVFAYLVESFPRNYSIVYYDQRGAGKTLRKNPFAKIGMAELRQDLLETVLYVKRTYKKEKIILLGHSWGSVLGSTFALEHPEHVSCCIGCGQMYCFRENERRAYSFLREAVLQRGTPKDKKAFRRLGGYPSEQCSLRALVGVTRMRSLQGRFGLAMSIDESAKRIIRSSPVSNWLDLLFFTLGGMRSAVLMREFWNYDLRDRGFTYRMPVCYIMGDRDRTTPYEIAREFFDRLDAPDKKWFILPDAGHFAMLDNVEAWRSDVQEVIDLIRE